MADYMTEARIAIAKHLIDDGVDFSHNTTALAREIADIVRPIIEAAVREQIATEIEREQVGARRRRAASVAVAYGLSARIARGQS